MIKDTLGFLDIRIQNFAAKTGSDDLRFEEDKKKAVWSVRYPITKVEFVLQKKENLFCPIATLYTRIYLGKNEQVFYHIPELIEELDPEDLQSYYYPYLESEERVEVCFHKLSAWFLRYLPRIHEIAKDAGNSDRIKEKKLDEISRFLVGERVSASMEGDACLDYETFVLLARYTGEGPYRDLLCGNYARAYKRYQKLAQKQRLTQYEMRILTKLEAGELPPLMDEACNTVLVFQKSYSDQAEGKGILRGALKMEILLGCFFALLIAGIVAFFSKGCLYYAGMQWYDGFLLAGSPAIFGGIAFRRGFRRKEDHFAELVTPQWAEKLSRWCFRILTALMLFLTISASLMHARFYEKEVVFNNGENPFVITFESGNYEKIKAVYYAKGLRNDFGEFIDRPSYLIEFEDGTIWDSDAFMEVDAAEKNVLPILEGYYDEILTIEEKNKLWK